MNHMTNITQLTEDLSSLYKEIRTGTVDLKQASELNNTAGKILSAYKVKLAYHAMRGEAPNIAFLSDEEESDPIGTRLTHPIKAQIPRGSRRN